MVIVLPIVLICRILSLLPSDAIFSCTCVCKTFRNFIRDPNFSELHFSKAHNRDSSLLIQDKSGASRIFIASIRDLDKYDPENFYTSFWQTLTTMSAHVFNVWHTLPLIVGSCNSLLCVRYVIYEISYLYVCNPLLGEFMLLPELRRALDLIIGFGSCPKTKEYKILRYPAFEPCTLVQKIGEWLKMSRLL